MDSGYDFRPRAEPRSARRKAVRKKMRGRRLDARWAAQHNWRMGMEISRTPQNISTKPYENMKRVVQAVGPDLHLVQTPTPSDQY